MMVRGVMALSKTPNRKRQANMPPKLCVAAVIMRMEPHVMTQPQMTLAMSVRWAR